MEILRTPDSRFDHLVQFDFVPRFIAVDDLRVHYVQEGPSDGDPVLLLHGEPSWSYLYRYMIAPLAASGLRVIAPDLIGFGRSDKPKFKKDHSYEGHVHWMTRFIEILDLKKITLFCQDWGSLIGLRVAAENEDRFSRIALGNGGLPTGDQKMPKAFLAWRLFANYSPYFPIAKIIQAGTTTRLSREVLSAYNAPFSDSSYLAGPRALPTLVPVHSDDPSSIANRNAWKVFENWRKPFLTLFSDRDPITRRGERVWQSRVPGAQGQEHQTIHGAGHFLQEDRGPELAAALIRLIQKTK